jgi:hypothetical protein
MDAGDRGQLHSCKWISNGSLRCSSSDRTDLDAAKLHLKNRRERDHSGDLGRTAVPLSPLLVRNDGDESGGSGEEGNVA